MLCGKKTLCELIHSLGEQAQREVKQVLIVKNYDKFSVKNTKCISTVSIFQCLAFS